MNIGEIIKGFYMKNHFWKRLIFVIAAVIIMGFSLSLLLLVDLGVDPCTTMNKAISMKLGMSIGNWQAIFNIVLLAVVIIFGGRNLGFGTVVNMFLVGYSIDFFSWIWNRTLPLQAFDLWWVKILVFIPALIVFVVSAAIYMDVDLGMAPYDAVPFIISNHLSGVPFKVVRIVFDFTVIAIGILFGARLEIVTVLMALTLGPAISFIGNKMDKFFK